MWLNKAIDQLRSINQSNEYKTVYLEPCVHVYIKFIQEFTVFPFTIRTRGGLNILHLNMIIIIITKVITTNWSVRCCLD